MIWLVCWEQALETQIQALERYYDEMASDEIRQLISNEIDNVINDQQRTRRLIQNIRQRMQRRLGNHGFFQAA